MDAGPRIDSYVWAGGREAMLRFGSEDGPTAVLALPLFEEANRTRAFGCAILRALAAREIGGLLPELPGQSESLVATEVATLADMRSAFGAVTAGRYAVALRSGALVVGELAPAWLLAPQSGPELLRELGRISGTPLNGASVSIAGNILSAKLLEELASPPPISDKGEIRILRLASDPGKADRQIDGAPIWRRAEPGNDIGLAHVLAADIAEWVASCAT